MVKTKKEIEKMLKNADEVKIICTDFSMYRLNDGANGLGYVAEAVIRKGDDLNNLTWVFSTYPESEMEFKERKVFRNGEIDFLYTENIQIRAS